MGLGAIEGGPIDTSNFQKNAECELMVKSCSTVFGCIKSAIHEMKLINYSWWRNSGHHQLQLVVCHPTIYSFFCLHPRWFSPRISEPWTVPSSAVFFCQICTTHWNPNEIDSISGMSPQKIRKLPVEFHSSTRHLSNGKRAPGCWGYVG